MKNRDRMEIISKILQATNGRVGATKTRIMYIAFITHAQMKEYLFILADNGMVKYDSLSQTFKTTRKGLSFLKTYNEIDRLTKVAQ
jgi:predicted transcriptional regulator